MYLDTYCREHIPVNLVAVMSLLWLSLSVRSGTVSVLILSTEFDIEYVFNFLQVKIYLIKDELIFYYHLLEKKG